MLNRQRVLMTIGGVFAVCMVVFLVWYMFWVNYVYQYQMGYSFDKMSGQVEILKNPGWVVATPWKKDIHTIDLRPSQVCMNANSRVLNCKLVRFNPYDAKEDKTKLDGFYKFIEWHGVGAGEETFGSSSAGPSTIYEILKSYAFNVNEGRDCPFLIIVDDMRRKAPDVEGGGLGTSDSK